MSTVVRKWSTDETSEPVGLSTMTLWAESDNAAQSTMTIVVGAYNSLCSVCVVPVEPEPDP